MSGARIKARSATYTYTGADGAKQTIKSFGGWFDSNRNEACGVALATDGQNRCLPSGANTSPYPFLADAACTKQFVRVVAGALPPKYVTSTATIAAGTAYRYSLPGAKITVTSVYVKSGDQCLLLGASPADSDFYDTNGPEIAPTNFVSFTVTTLIL